MAVSISISITQNSQNITNNTSNVTVKVNCSWTGGSHNAVVAANGDPQANGSVTIDGTSYSFRSTFNTGKTSTGSQTLYSKTVNITHTSTGTKTLAVSASFNTYVSSGTVKASTSKVLTTIPRKSTLSVSNGTLGTAQTLTVTRQATSFTHTITAKCGTASSTICTKVTTTSISFTPPLSWASQNTTGASVSVTYTITTYNGSTSVGSNSYTKTCSIPASVKPSCTVSISDPTGNLTKYGGYVKGHSKLNVTVTPTTSYGSAIASYKTTANGSTYTSASFTTDVLKTSGDMTVSATVTDKRNRTSTAATKSVTVLNYSAPNISRLTVGRCNEDGSINDQGTHVIVSYTYSIASLNDKNTAKCSLEYKKSADSTYTIASNFTPSASGSYIFAAETGSSYDVRFTVADDLDTSFKLTSVSTAFTIMHFSANGHGMGIGKVAEYEDVLDIGMQTRMMGGIMHPVLEPDTDLNDIRTPNTYIGANISNYNYTCGGEALPITSGTFTLEVIGCGEVGQVRQKLIKCIKDNQLEYERFYYSNSWGSWYVARCTKNVTFTPSTNTSITRYSIYRQGDIVTLFLCVKYSQAVSAGTNVQIGTIPAEDAPGSTVATVGISGTTGTGACWVRNDGSVMYRPNAAHAANAAIEFNATWSVAAIWK